MKRFSIVLVVWCLVALSACSSPRFKQKEGELLTYITVDGSKRFSYVVPMKYRPLRISDIEMKTSRRQGLPTKSTDSVERTVKRKMKLYCRQGFFIYERRYQQNSYKIQGECNEGATTEERENAKEEQLKKTVKEKETAKEKKAGQQK